MRLGQAKYGYVYEFCSAGDATCYAGNVMIMITQANGNRTTITTSTDWECSPSPIVFNHLFGGESYNGSLDQPGWNEPNFSPLVPWTSAPLRFPNVSLVSTGGPTPIQIMNNVSAISITTGPGIPVISGGEFVKSDSSPNVWWVANNSNIKNFVTVCQPCPAINACANLNTVTEAYIDSLTQGANFSCSMLPNATSNSPYIFDFQRNMAGFCTLTLPPAPQNTMITIVHGEILDPSGNVDNTFGASSPPRTCNVNVINCADQMDQYIYGSDGLTGYHTYTPSFTFHGFRYIALFGWPANSSSPNNSTIICHQTYTGVMDAGSVSFNQSYNVLNNIQAAIVQTQKSNIFSIPSDCPTREKRGWMGDAQVSSSQALMNLRLSPLYENWARSHSDSLFMSCANSNDLNALVNTPHQRGLSGIHILDAMINAPQRPAQYLCCGTRNEFGCQPGLTPVNATNSLPDVIPFDSISGWPGDFIWEISGEVIPYNTFKHENNIPSLQLLWPYITNHLQFASTAAALNSNGLLNWGPYADWLATEGVSRDFSENWYYLLSMNIGAELATVLNFTNEAVAYTALANTISTAMVSQFFSTNNNYWDGSSNMNAQAMALAVNLGGSLITANQTAGIAQNMATDCSNHGYHPTGGVASVRYILQGLVAGNYSNYSLQMGTVPTSPSWAYMAQDIMPGTIWEEWSGDATHSDGSKNHPMLTGGIGLWLYENALGLRFTHRIRSTSLSFPIDHVHDEVSKLLYSNISSLGYDPRYYGLTNEETKLALQLSQHAQLFSGKVWTIDEYLSESILQTKKLNIVTSPRQITPVVTIMPDNYIMKEIGSATGYHQTPYGKTIVNWVYDNTHYNSITMKTFIPSGGVHGRIGIPLLLLSELSNYHATKTLVLQGTVSHSIENIMQQEIIHGQIHIKNTNEVSKQSDLYQSCSIIGTTNQNKHTICYCSLLSTNVSSVHTITIPRIVTYTEMEDLGRLHYVGEPDHTPMLESSYLFMETNWGYWNINVQMI